MRLELEPLEQEEEESKEFEEEFENVVAVLHEVPDGVEETLFLWSLVSFPRIRRKREIKLRGILVSFHALVFNNTSV